jgi:hypothetical protein
MGATAAIVIQGVVAAGAAVATTDAQRKSAHQAADLQKANKPVAPPQATQIPGTMRQTGGPVMPSPTMLTGSSGIDPGSLNLGKNQLLGS